MLSHIQKINPEATGYESSSLTEEKEKVQRALEEAGRLASKLRMARCSPRIIQLDAMSKQKHGKQRKAIQQIETAKLASEYRQFRQGVDDLMASLRPAYMNQIKGAPTVSISEQRELGLVGRVKINQLATGGGAAMMKEGNVVRVRVGDHHLKYLANTFC